MNHSNLPKEPYTYTYIHMYIHISGADTFDFPIFLPFLCEPSIPASSFHSFSGRYTWIDRGMEAIFSSLRVWKIQLHYIRRHDINPSYWCNSTNASRMWKMEVEWGMGEGATDKKVSVGELSLLKNWSPDARQPSIERARKGIRENL